ncbi:MAG: hypothetical protein GY775_06825 [Candidatus Scalindua sp.]|nr:hypothetical protein [Candidatus Scalindua sp.]
MSKYPNRFEILENDGKILKFRVDQLTNDLDECFIKHYINDEDQGNTSEITIPKILEYNVSKSGKYTFSFFKHDPDVPFDALESGIDLNEDNEPIWEQDVFVIKSDTYGLTKKRIEELAHKYAPFVFMDEGEEYLPASINYLLNRDEGGEIKDENLNVDITLQLPKTKDIHLAYNDLPDVLPFNGHKDSVLNTIGFSVLKLLGHKTKRDALDKRKGDRDNVTVYYSFIPNPNKKNQAILNYHFLYAYDPKQEEEGSVKFASHIFDRESISIVFRYDRDNYNVDPVPECIIYGAHLEGQTMGSVKQDNDDWEKLQTWTCGRVKVMWEDVYRIKETHPAVAVARGSHAPYPAPGHYAVYIFGKPQVEPAGTGKVLVHEGVLLNTDLGNGVKEVFHYKLNDLKLGNITSKSILAYSGFIVDILGPKDAKFPPFTERELNIDKWVNGNEKDVIYEWDPAKVEKETKDKFVTLLDSINDKLA